MELDATWVNDPDATPPRDRQLTLRLPGLDGHEAQPMRKSRKGFSAGGRNRTRWLEQWRAQTNPTRDDPAICPPVTLGQGALFTVPRQLTLATARRMRDRVVDGLDAIAPLAAAYAAEHNYSKAWLQDCTKMIRLALAVRDADGRSLVDEEALDDLQYYRDPVVSILRRAGVTEPRRPRVGPWASLLAPRDDRRPSPPRPYVRPERPPRSPGAASRPRVAKSCADCQAWIATPTTEYCSACATWRGRESRDLHPLGDCSRCGREQLPLGQGSHCRGCILHLAANGPEAEQQPWTQLWIGGVFGHKLRYLKGELGYEPGSDHPARDRAFASRRRPELPLGEHLIDPRQTVLLDMTRDWTRILASGGQQPYRLTASARRLLDNFEETAREQQWEEGPRRNATRTLRFLLSWLGAEAPIFEADIYSLASANTPNFSARRVIEFLEPRGLLIPDPEHRRDRNQQAIENIIEQFPDQIAEELRIWVRVLRSQGRWKHTARTFKGIRRYLAIAQPVIADWAGRVASLREITADDVKAAIDSRTGNPGRAIHIVLRNIFRALRQERAVFLDPTRGLSFGAVKSLPDSVPSDRLQGLLDHAPNPMSRLAAALVAIHALGGSTICGLLLDDLDLASGKLVLRQGSWSRAIWLEDLTLQLASDWLRERRRRWPGSTNPHLLVTQQTAMRADHIKITVGAFERTFRAAKLTMAQTRQDRILYEARESADPLHLMRLFGISDGTAMRYITAAHPERTAKLPR